MNTLGVSLSRLFGNLKRLLPDKDSQYRWERIVKSDRVSGQGSWSEGDWGRGVQRGTGGLHLSNYTSIMYRPIRVIWFPKLRCSILRTSSSYILLYSWLIIHLPRTRFLSVSLNLNVWRNRFILDGLSSRKCLWLRKLAVELRHLICPIHFNVGKMSTSFFVLFIKWIFYPGPKILVTTKV